MIDHISIPVRDLAQRAMANPGSAPDIPITTTPHSSATGTGIASRW